MLALSVGLPVYNAMPFLPEAVESLLGQTFSDFELLIVDDGSTDGSRDYLKTIKDPRLRLISQPNQGLSATLNRMLHEAKGTWLVRQDADDIAYPKRIKLIAEAVQLYPSAGMFYSFADQLPWAPGRRPFRTTVADPETLRAITRAGYLLAICHPTAVLNVRKTLGVGGYRIDLRSAQDSELWWRMALNHEIRLIPEYTLAYRLTGSSVSNSGLIRQAEYSAFSQYLLLSKLWGFPAEPFDAVQPCLMDMINLKELRCRGYLRRLAIDFGNGRIASSFWHAILSTWAAPGYVLERVMQAAVQRIYEQSMRGDRLEISGIDPLEYAKRFERLWPRAVLSQMT